MSATITTGLPASGAATGFEDGFSMHTTRGGDWNMSIMVESLLEWLAGSGDDVIIYTAEADGTITRTAGELGGAITLLEVSGTVLDIDDVVGFHIRRRT